MSTMDRPATHVSYITLLANRLALGSVPVTFDPSFEFTITESNMISGQYQSGGQNLPSNYSHTDVSNGNMVDNRLTTTDRSKYP